MKRLLVLLLSSFGLIAMAPQNGDAPVHQWPTITIKTADGGQFVFEPAMLERLQSDYLKSLVFSGTQFAEFATGQPVIELPAEVGIDRKTVELVIKIANADDATRAKILWNLSVETLCQLSRAFDFLASQCLYQCATIAYITSVLRDATAMQLPELREQIEVMLHRIAPEPFQLPGDHACLLYCALHGHEFNPELEHRLEEYTAHQLLNNAQFFAQSLAPVPFENDQHLPACACSLFVANSDLMRTKLLPAQVLHPELINNRCIPGITRAISPDSTYVCLQDDHFQLHVFNTQTTREITQTPIKGYSALFSPDGTFLFVFPANNTIAIYQTKTMALMHTLPGADANMSPDGKIIWVKNYNGITLYNAQTMRPINTEPIPGQWAQFSPDSALLLVDCGITANILYDARTGQKILGAPIVCCEAQFSPDGQWISDERAGQTILYKTRTMERVGTAQGKIVRFSADSKLLLLNEEVTTTVTFYDTQTMRLIDVHQTPDMGWVVANPNCSILLVTTDNASILYNTKTKLPQAKIPLPNCGGQFSPDGQLLSLRTRDETIRIYSTQTMRQLASLSLGNKFCIAETFKSFGNEGLGFPLVERGDDGAHVITFVCNNNTAQQLAALAAMHRHDATDGVARILDAKKYLWADILEHAPETLQMFCQDR